MSPDAAKVVKGVLVIFCTTMTVMSMTYFGWSSIIVMLIGLGIVGGVLYRISRR